MPLRPDVRRRLRSWAAYWRATGVIPRWQLIVVYALIVGAGAVGFVQVNDALDEVQASRVATCDDNAQKNRDTVAELDRRLALIKDPRRRARAAESRDFTIGLINALAPPRSHEQCVQLVEHPPAKRPQPRKR